MQTHRLGNVCTKIGSGVTPRGGSDVYISSGTALIRSQNIYNDAFHFEGLAFIGQKHADEMRGVEVQAGDVLLNITGDSVARVCRAPPDVLPARVNQHVTIIRPDPAILDSRFLHYYLASPAKQASMLSLAGGGATRNALTKGMIENFEIPALTIDEQRAISAVLGALDDKIEQNRRTSRKLEELARGMFKAWFVDFEPVHAKAAGATSYPGMSAAVFDAFPDSFAESSMGLIPNGWNVGDVQSLCASISSGGTPSRKNANYWQDGTIDWFKTGELFDGPLLTSEERITQIGLDSSSCKLWPKGTILFALYASPTVGRLGILTSEGTSNQAAAGLIAHVDVGIPFLAHALFFARDELQRIAVGAAQQNINQQVLRSHRTLIPNSKIRLAYSDTAGTYLAAQTQLALESRQLAKLRDYLLPKLLSGQVRVKDAEKIVAKEGR